MYDMEEALKNQIKIEWNQLTLINIRSQDSAYKDR